MIEIALTGLAVLVAGTLAIARGPLGRRDPLALERLMPAYLAVLTLIYLLCAWPETPRQGAMALAAVVFFSLSAWRLRAGPGSGKVRKSWVQGWLRQVAKTFFASATLLVAVAERSIPTFVYSDLIAVATWASGVFLTVGARSDKRLILAQALGAWSFYLFAWGSSSGMLLLFAPLLYLYDFRQTLCPKEHKGAAKVQAAEPNTPQVSALPSEK